MAQRTDLVCRSSRLDLRGCSIAQAEEPWTIPARAGYREGDLGQTAVGGAVPGKSVSKHHDPLKLTIPLACQDVRPVLAVDFRDRKPGRWHPEQWNREIARPNPPRRTLIKFTATD